MRKALTGLTLTGGAVLFLSLVLGQACATKKMVIEQVAKVDQEVTDVKNSVEANQKKLKEHDAKLADNDKQLANVGSAVGKQEQQLKDAQSKIDVVKAIAEGTLIGQAIITDEGSKFKFDSFELGPEAKAILDGFVQKLVAEKVGFFIEIRGYTDNVGEKAYNNELGKRRAEAVRDYLFTEYHIPLYRLQMYSFGSANPIGDNATKEGRAMNRRVEVLAYK